MKRAGAGYSLIEFMIAMLLGLIILAGVDVVFQSQRQVYRTSSSQALLQNSENAVAAIVVPTIRGAGYAGCASLGNAVSVIKSTALAYRISPFIYGYDAGNTKPGDSFTISADNAANDPTAGDWSPALDTSLTGVAEKGSDMIVVTGEVPGNMPVSVTAFDLSSTQATLESAVPVTNALYPQLGVGAIGAITDCTQAHVFQVSALSGDSKTISFAVGTGTPGNTATPLFSYLPGAQFALLQQVAFYVGRGSGGQSALYRATMSGGTWNQEQLVPGVENMQVLYGIGAAGNTTQWVAASQMASGDWSTVNAVQLALLMVGDAGSNSGGGKSEASSSCSGNGSSLLKTCVGVPADTRLRHVYTLTVDLRNAAL